MNKLNILTIMLLATFTLTLAQSPEAKNNLKELKGEVTKITIETSEGNVEFTGEDAQALVSQMKKKSKRNFVFIDDEGKTKEITVDVEDTDGKKVVIVKKNINGKETIEKYEGEEAEMHMLKMKDEHGMKFISEDGDIHIIVKDDDDLIWVSNDDDELMKKEINVEVVDGVKKITVTTTNDGEEKVEIYEGEEADKFLETEEHGDKKIIKKRIIIETEHDDENEKEKN